MAELLANYSMSEILIFVIAIALALKGIVEFIDWIKERGKKYFDKETTSVEQIKKLEEKNAEQDEKITQILDSQNKIQENMDIIMKQIQSLISSDRDAIKTYITKDHHYFCYEAGWIDDYNLDCLEKRYQKYVEEGGNSFISSLMEEIRSLPRQPIYRDDT